MQSISKKQWLIGGLESIMFLSFFFGWFFTNQSIDALRGGGWLLITGCFSLGISLLCLVVFIAKGKMIPWESSLIAFAPSLFFVQESVFILFLVMGLALCATGLFHMRQDLNFNMRIHIRKSMQHGIGWLVLAFAVVIAAFYYMHIRTMNAEALLQKFSFDTASQTVLAQALGLMNPEFKRVNRDHVTVDEFLLAFQENQSMEEIGMSVPSDDALLQMAGITASDPRAQQTLIQIKKGLDSNVAAINMKNIVLEQGRIKLSDSVGRTLSGKEPVADVLAQIIDRRIHTYFTPDAAHGAASVLPFALSIILFITLWSFGSFLNILWRAVTALFFFLLCYFGFIEVKKVMVEQEVIG